MAAGFHLARPAPLRSPISLAPMIDVLLILLVFFMVTSTYLDLDMIPAVAPSEDSARAPQTTPTAEGAAPTLLIRVGADGVPALRGQPLSGPALTRELRAAAEQIPPPRVLVLPSGAAPVQALVGIMDTAAEVGLTSLRVVRLEAMP